MMNLGTLFIIIIIIIIITSQTVKIKTIIKIILYIG